jgi:hypothetical protein
MTCGLSAALSIIVMWAERVPNADGVNVIEIVHVEAADSDDPQVLVCANSADDGLMLEIAIALEVLLVKEMARGGLVSPIAVGAMPGFVELKVVGVIPLPLRLMTWGLSVAVSVIVILPNRAPVADGVKVMEIVQLLLPARLFPQLLTSV